HDLIGLILRLALRDTRRERGDRERRTHAEHPDSLAPRRLLGRPGRLLRLTARAALARFGRELPPQDVELSAQRARVAPLARRRALAARDRAQSTELADAVGRVEPPADLLGLLRFGRNLVHSPSLSCSARPAARPPPARIPQRAPA